MNNEALLRKFLIEKRAVMLRAAYAITHNLADAEDLVQDASLKALRGIPRYRRNLSSMDSWFRLIMRRLWIDDTRKARTNPTHRPPAYSEEYDTRTAHSDPAGEAIAGWMMDAAMGALSAEEEQILLEMAEGFESEEIGEMRGRSPEYVRTKACRARTKISRLHL